MKHQILSARSSSRTLKNVTCLHVVYRCCFNQSSYNSLAFNKNKLRGNRALKDVRTSTNHSNKATRRSVTFVLPPPPTARNRFFRIFYNIIQLSIVAYFSHFYSSIYGFLSLSLRLASQWNFSFIASTSSLYCSLDSFTFAGNAFFSSILYLQFFKPNTCYCVAILIEVSKVCSSCDCKMKFMSPKVVVTPKLKEALISAVMVNKTLFSMTVKCVINEVWFLL